MTGRAAAALSTSLLLALAGAHTLSPLAAQERPAPPPVEEVVAELDGLCEAAWREAGVRVAPEADPAELFRRASLDAAGVVPSEETVAKLLRRGAKPPPWPQLVEALLHGPEHAGFLATRWANLLVGRRALLEVAPGTAHPLHTWLRQRLQANTPWDVVVRELLSARGDPRANGAAGYLVRYEGRPAEMAGNAMRVFQGQQVQCAECHDHPYKEQWKQRDFWGVAAFFGRAAVVREMDRIRLVERERGQVRIPGPPGAPGPEVPPRFITGESTDPGEGDFRRDELARMVTSPNNPWFARATVNRVWSFFFGAGFSDPDDLAVPALAAVEQRLTADFEASGYDMRRLCRVILLSAAYRRSAGGPAQGAFEAQELFARARLRPLLQEQLWASFVRATGYEEALAAWPDPEQAANQRRALRRRFYDAFGRDGEAPPREHSLSQALLLLNGPLTNDVLRADRSPLLTRLLGLSPDERTTVIYLRVFGRAPSASELRALRPRGLSSEEEAQFLQDVFWALLNGSEFLYQH